MTTCWQCFGDPCVVLDARRCCLHVRLSRAVGELEGIAQLKRYSSKKSSLSEDLGCDFAARARRHPQTPRSEGPFFWSSPERHRLSSDKLDNLEEVRLSCAKNPGMSDSAGPGRVAPDLREGYSRISGADRRGPGFLVGWPPQQAGWHAGQNYTSDEYASLVDSDDDIETLFLLGWGASTGETLLDKFAMRFGRTRRDFCRLSLHDTARRPRWRRLPFDRRPRQP